VKACRGCKLGYQNGTRDISKAKCKIKVCCIMKNYNSCADCDIYESYAIISKFQSNNGYKYRKYRQALEFVRLHGYAKFIEIADKWKIQFGRYE